MSKHKFVLNIALIVLFLVCTFVPLVFADFEGGKIDENEKRQLAVFPELSGENAVAIEELPDELENWIGDNVGFRAYFNYIYKRMSFNFFGISPTDRVHIGKNGWLFFTSNNNLEIAKGEHVISEEKLKKIAEKQQALSDHYKAEGIDYYFLLLPSKASVYPEYITGKYGITETSVDIVEKYLLENTDVKVINPKQKIIANKNQEFLLYDKSDTHWNIYGSYIGYQAIMERLKNDGVINTIVNFIPKFSYGNARRTDIGDLMIGNNLVEPTINILAEYDRNIKKDTTSEVFVNFSKALDIAVSEQIDKNIIRDEIRLINDKDNINTKSVLLYGDSMLMYEYGILEYIAESFSYVQYVRGATGPLDIVDDVVKPDIVVFEVFERLIEEYAIYENMPMKKVTDIELKNLKMLPKQTADTWIATNGLCLENSNNGELVLKSEAYRYKIEGWAIDYNNNTNLSGVYLDVNGELYDCRYFIDSPDVAEVLNGNFDKSRFSFDISKAFIINNNITEFKFIMVSSDGEHYYEPIVFKLDITDETITDDITNGI